jgi:ABC-type transport system involved in cytochrome c biogenesis ATPase subunit
MQPIIQISGLSKTYASGLTALKSVDLAIRRGEIFALLGPNGAGKTTLISIVCGLVKRSTGSVTVDGLDIDRDYRAVRSRIGLVPQELTADAFETVWATVSFSRGLFGKPSNAAHIEKILRQLSLWEKRDSKIMTLSGGMKRRVLIAKALSHEPRPPVPRRALGRRRRRASPRHVGRRPRPPGCRRHHHPDDALPRRGGGDGRSHRRHRQGRTDPRRGEAGADDEARQEDAGDPAVRRPSPRYRRSARSGYGADARRPRASELVYTYDTKPPSAPASPPSSRILAAAGLRFRDLRTEPVLARGHLRQPW